MKSKRLWFASLVPVAAALLVAGGLAAEASPPGATVKVATNATLASPPSSVIVGIDYSCMPSQFSFASVSIDQSQFVGGASGSRVDVFGFGNFQPVCDDKSHHAEVVVSSFYGFYGPSTFTAGGATASAFVASGAASAQTSAEINVK